jgi:hypothetical protein
MFKGLRSLLALRRMPVHAEAHLAKFGQAHNYDVRLARVKKPFNWRLARRLGW